MTGNITSTASMLSADAELDIEVTGSMTGNITVTASSQDSYADTYMDLYGASSVTGNLSVTASGTSADTHLHVDNHGVGDISGTFTATASSYDAYAHLVVNSWGSGDITGDFTGTASGISSEVELEMDTNDGDYQGNVQVVASAMYSTGHLSMDIDGMFTGDLELRATGDYSIVNTTDEDVHVTGDFTGDITLQAGTINAANSAVVDSNAMVSADIWVEGDITGDLNAYAYGASLVSAEITADRLLGDINIKSANLEGGSLVSLDINVESMTAIEYSDELSQDVVTSSGLSTGIRGIATRSPWQVRSPTSRGSFASVASRRMLRVRPSVVALPLMAWRR
jgi:hypothetical protein